MSLATTLSPLGSNGALVVGFVAGFAVAVVAWFALREGFSQPLFARKNFRGATVPVGVGIILAVTPVVVTGMWRVVSVVFAWDEPALPVLGVGIMVSLGFGLLGFFDDIGATGDDRGFRGHLSALAGGRLTTGGFKLIGGGVLALVVTPATGEFSLWRLLLGAAVISLGANLGNLFDRAPARCTKVSLLCGAVLILTAGAADGYALTGVAVILGAATGLLAFDARERLMLGDAGSNVLGAMLAWGLVASTDWIAQVVALVVLVGLNAVSEKVSFSQVIDAVPALRAIDQLGRRPPDRS